MTYDADDPIWLKPTVALYYVQAKYGITVQAQTLRRWADRDHVRRQAGRYSLRDLDSYLATRNQSSRSAHGLLRRGETRRKADVAD